MEMWFCFVKQILPIHGRHRQLRSCRGESRVTGEDVRRAAENRPVAPNPAMREKADIAQDPALRDCWRIWTRSRHGVFTPWPASQNRLIWQHENKSNTPDAPAAVIKCDPCGFSRWLRHTQ